MMNGIDALAAWAGAAGWALVGLRTPSGITVTVAFAIAARLLRAVSLGGAIAGALVTFLLWIAWPPTVAVLFLVFVLTWAATRAGQHRKQRLGTAEQSSGRSASQVFANLAVAAIAAIAATYLHQPLLMFACAAALSEAATDTVSSEMGQALGAEPVLITSLRPVPVGTDGGISGPGTLAGIAAALVVSGVAFLVRVIPGHGFAIVATAGITGMLFDSFLGATLERARFLDNDQVNLAGTFFAAAISVLLASLWP